MDETPEQQLRAGLDAMREAISQEGEPRFKDFWEIRATCIPLFKEGIHPAVRAQFWQEFSELSKEARGLKSFLNKQTADTVEQIESALRALEKRIQSIDAEIQASKMPSTSFKHLEPMQQELNVLNACASAIHALRKEVIGMRARLQVKHPLFAKLSSLGDQVFPRRRELIKELSERFSGEVDRFIKTELQGPPSRLREKIKAFQQAAKVFTLNANAFTATREQLSQCWDSVRKLDQEKKREWVAHREQITSLAEQIDQVMEEELSLDEVNQKLNCLHQETKQLNVGPKESALLREKFAKARRQLFVKEEEAWFANNPPIDALLAKKEESKQKLEEYRKAKGNASGFEQAIEYDRLFSEEKERLTKIETAIRESQNNSAGSALRPLQGPDSR